MRRSKKVIGWKTPPVVTWSNLKQEFYLLTKNYNALILNDHYKSICKTLEYNIKVAKRSHFNKQICNAKNKIKTTWNVVKTVTGKKPINNDIHNLNTDGKIIGNNQLLSIYFNEYFPTAADKIINKMKTITHSIITCLMKYLQKSFKNTFLSIMIKHTCHTETERL